MSAKPKKRAPREFIAYKRVKASGYQFAERSQKNEDAIDALAPDCGNYEKLILIEKSALDQALAKNKRLANLLKMAWGFVDRYDNVGIARAEIKEALTQLEKKVNNE